MVFRQLFVAMFAASLVGVSGCSNGVVEKKWGRSSLSPFNREIREMDLEVIADLNHRKSLMEDRLRELNSAAPPRSFFPALNLAILVQRHSERESLQDQIEACNALIALIILGD